MNIKQAIEWLQSLENKHGSSTFIYFDCPNCEKSYSPDKIVAQAIHITTEKK